MIRNGLSKISPRRADPSLLHSFGALDFDTKGLPADFSIYDGRPIPNQNTFDDRFVPSLRPLPMGCTAETTTFIAGLEDGASLYDPVDFYFATAPGADGEGRDIRVALQTAIDRGFRLTDHSLGAKRTAYFNCYGAGAIDDFDAARIALWINQDEKRGVSVGSYFYREFLQPDAKGSLPLPSFNTALASLHNYLVTGWRTLPDDTDELECIMWIGENYGNAGLVYMSRVIFNALMAQPWTGAFTITKTTSQTPVPIGITAILDHLTYFIRQLFHV